MPAVSDILMEVFNESKRYVEIRANIIKLELVEKTAKLITQLCLMLVLIFMIFLIFLFLGISLAAQLSLILKSEALGYVIVAGVFVIATFILVFIVKRILFNTIINNLISLIYASSAKPTHTKSTAASE